MERLWAGDRPYPQAFHPARIALVGRRPADLRDVMVKGEAGILACSPPDFRPTYEPPRRKLPRPSGAIAPIYSAAAPKLRDPSFDAAWADEVGAWTAIR